MARLWRVLVAALTGLLVGGAGWAATPGPVCRTACTARVTDAGLVARIEAALANHRVVATSRRAATTSTNDVTFCESRQVHLHATTTSPAGDNDQTLDGTWVVELLDETPVLSLGIGESTPRRFAVAVDANGRPVLHGFETTIEDAGAACAG